MFRSGNDIVLDHLLQLHEEGAVANNADHEVLVLLRVFLRFSQGLRTHHVELDLPAAQIEIGSDQIGPFGHARVSLQRAGMHLHVEDRSLNQVDVLQVGHRLDTGRRAVDVGALGRRTGIAQWCPGLAAIRRGPAEQAVGHVSRHRSDGGPLALSWQGLVLPQFLKQ